MRVAFAYGFDDKSWPGGRNYFSNLLKAIEIVAPESLELVLLTGLKTKTALPTEFPQMEVLRTPLLDRKSPAWIVREATTLLTGGDPMLSTFLRSHGVDVLSHGGGLGLGSGIKSLAWLPDFQFLYFPEYWKPRHLRSTKRTYKMACDTADALVVSSKSALADLETFAPSCHARTHVLQFVSTRVEMLNLPTKSDLLERYSLPTRYFHLPNQFWAHKNHSVVIDALALLKSQGVDVIIVCTGQTADIRRPEYFDSLMKRSRVLGVSDNLRVLGLVPYTDLQALMVHAQAIINPSRFEGWSTTVEEAKSLGKKVILSDIPVHREQAPRNAAYFGTADAPALASLLLEAITAKYSEVDEAQVVSRHEADMKAFGRYYLDILRTL